MVLLLAMTKLETVSVDSRVTRLGNWLGWKLGARLVKNWVRWWVQKWVVVWAERKDFELVGWTVTSLAMVLVTVLGLAWACWLGNQWGQWLGRALELVSEKRMGIEQIQLVV